MDLILEAIADITEHYIPVRLINYYSFFTNSWFIFEVSVAFYLMWRRRKARKHEKYKTLYDESIIFMFSGNTRRPKNKTN